MPVVDRECLMVDLGWGTRLGRDRTGASTFDEENPTCPYHDKIPRHNLNQSVCWNDVNM